MCDALHYAHYTFSLLFSMDTLDSSFSFYEFVQLSFLSFWLYFHFFFFLFPIYFSYVLVMMPLLKALLYLARASLSFLIFLSAAHALLPLARVHTKCVVYTVYNHSGPARLKQAVCGWGIDPRDRPCYLIVLYSPVLKVTVGWYYLMSCFVYTWLMYGLGNHSAVIVAIIPNLHYGLLSVDLLNVQ